MAAAIARALARNRRSVWAAFGLLALGACSGARRLVLFERDAATDSGARGADAGPPLDAGAAPLDAGAPPIDAGTGPADASAALDGSGAVELHGGDGGIAYVDLCPEDQALIGYLGSVQDIGTRAEPLHAVGSLQGLCGALELGPERELRVSSSAALPVRGDPNALRQVGAFEQRCPADQVVVGVEGRSGIALDRVAFVCARIRAGTSDGGPELEHDDVAALQPAGGDGGTAFSGRCPPGELARGHQLRAGRWLDAFGLVCAP